MAQKPSLPKGTRDFLPTAMLQREYILDRVRKVFKKYGFGPIETPAMEKLETLTGKYGEEGDRLIFRLLPRGEKLEKALQTPEDFKGSVEEALRYDLTVPFARFVVQNQNELHFPFKRYQIQSVWRADRPQKGRFREFTQCDADAVGSTSLLQELEFMAIYQEVFGALKLPVKVKINHRQILAGLTQAFGVKEHWQAFTVALDKLDKIGLSGVSKELEERQLPDGAKKALETIVNLKGDFSAKLEQLTEIVERTDAGRKGLEDLRFVWQGAQELGLAADLELDLSLARGLDYYTGCIFEVVPEGLKLGSVGGGGRYDDLTGIFGMKDMPGIGISFGLDRIHIAMLDLDLFPPLAGSRTEVLFINFGKEEGLHSLRLAQELRRLGVPSEVYPDAVKLKKQMSYADKNGIQHVVMIGAEEMKKGRYTLKLMESGEQKELSRLELLEYFNPQAPTSHGRH